MSSANSAKAVDAIPAAAGPAPQPPAKPSAATVAKARFPRVNGAIDRAIRVLSLVAGAAELIANAPSKLLYTEVKEDRPQTAGGGGSPYAVYFGSVPDFRDDLSGVLFADVRPDSPAGKAGLKAGDLLVEFAGAPIKNLYDFTDALGSKKPGDVVPVVVKRNGESIKVNVTLEVRK